MKRFVKIYILLLLAAGAFLITETDNVLHGKKGKDDPETFYSGDGSEILADCYETAESCESNGEAVFYSCRVQRVVDGDTICVIMDSSGEEVKVRFIGVNTPESVSGDESENCQEGTEAATFTTNFFSVGSEIFLEFDEETTDLYGRTLAYVWLSKDVNTDSFDDFCQYNYGAILLKNTYCEAVYYEPNGKYKDWYEQLEAEYQ